MADDVLQMEGAMASFFDLADEQLKQAYDAAPEGFTGPYCVVALMKLLLPVWTVNGFRRPYTGSFADAPAGRRDRESCQGDRGEKVTRRGYSSLPSSRNGLFYAWPSACAISKSQPLGQAWRGVSRVGAA